MTGKPLAAHGTYARYVGRPGSGIPGCHCEPCMAAMRAYSRRRALLAATGRDLTVDAAPVTARLRKLRAAGAGWNELVAVTGCSSSTISALLHGTRRTVLRTTAQTLLTVRLAQVICPKRSVPALGSTRRLRALVAAGHPVKVIRQVCALDQTTISQLLSGTAASVRAETHQRVDAAFEQMAMRTGTSARSLERARAERWAPPLAWDDPDDPDAQPNLGDHTPRVAAIVEDTAELTRLGVPRDVIAARLGVSWNAVEKAHERFGVPVPELAA